MTDKEVMKMALEALKAHADFGIKADKAIEALRQALAQPDSTSDSATRSADSAESFCKQELHNLMSVAGRMALELECLLLDTKDLSVVSKWWDTGMQSLQAYRDYIWSITHGKDEMVELAQTEQSSVTSGCCAECGVKASDGYALYCVKCTEEFAQPEQEPVAWMYKCGSDVQINTLPSECYGDNWIRTPLYTAPPKREWVGITADEVLKFYEEHAKYQEESPALSGWYDFANAIESKLKDKNK